MTIFTFSVKQQLIKNALYYYGSLLLQIRNKITHYAISSSKLHTEHRLSKNCGLFATTVVFVGSKLT